MTSNERVALETLKSVREYLDHVERYRYGSSWPTAGSVSEMRAEVDQVIGIISNEAAPPVVFGADLRAISGHVG